MKKASVNRLLPSQIIAKHLTENNQLDGMLAAAEIVAKRERVVSSHFPLRTTNAQTCHVCDRLLLDVGRDLGFVECPFHLK